MAEYLIQGETLTGIADKIRPLLGLTGTMTPEQMQTNLTTEQANIAAALAALAEKGVEVPEGANSNALAGLIAAINAGAKVAIGTYTAAVDISTDDITISHNLGAIPNRLLFMLTDNGGKTTGLHRPVPFFYIDEEQCLLCSKTSSNVSLTSIEYRILEDTISRIAKDDSTISLGDSVNVWHGNIFAGWTILWIVMG